VKKSLLSIKGTLLLGMLSMSIVVLAACAPAAATVPTTTPISAATNTAAVEPTAAAAVTESAAATEPSAETETPAATALATVDSSASYTDPFAYCTAVGTIDQPDARFTGERISDAMAKAIRKAVDASDDAPIDMFKQASSWRCVDGKVYGCFVGANLPCDAKANTDKTPSDAINSFCTENKNADSIPAAVTGHETVYEWGCKDGKAEIMKQVFQVDAQGYIADIWYPLEQPQ
jgi:hypothetical protein